MAGTAFDSQASTLAEYAVNHNDPAVTSITQSLHKTFNVIQDVKFRTDQSMIQKGVRWTDVSQFSVNYRTLHSVPTVTKAKPTPYMEQAYILSNQFQIDKRDKDKNTIQDPLQMQVDGWMEAFNYDFNFKFFNNAQDGAAGHDVNAPVGIRTRLDNPQTYGCALNGAVADLKIDAGVTATTGMSQDNALLLIDRIQTLLDYMGSSDGDNIVLYMNDYMKRAFKWAVMKLGPSAGWSNTKDAFDRGVEKYLNATIRDVGRRADQSTRIISATETNTGADGASTFTSIYAVHHEVGYFEGWQYEALKPVNLGVDPTNGVAINVVVDWPFGFWMQHTRAIGRLFDINLGATPA